jgi:hypothetical protein
MKVVVTKFKDGTFFASDGDLTIVVESATEVSTWTSWKTKTNLDTVKTFVNSMGGDCDMIEFSEDNVSFRKIDYSKAFG